MSRRIKAWATGVASRQGPWVEVGIPLAAVFGLTVLAHGLLIPWLGFYWDDLPKSWFLHLFGPMGFWKVYQVDRPFLPWIYMLTTPILGVTPLGWQILGLLAAGCRWQRCLVVDAHPLARPGAIGASCAHLLRCLPGIHAGSDFADLQSLLSALWNVPRLPCAPRSLPSEGTPRQVDDCAQLDCADLGPLRL